MIVNCNKGGVDASIYSQGMDRVEFGRTKGWICGKLRMVCISVQTFLTTTRRGYSKTIITHED
jgi:hypothetical protein